MAEHAHEEGEEHHLSPWPLLVGFGIPLALAGAPFWIQHDLPLAMVPGIALFFVGLGGWVLTDMRGRSRSWIGDTAEAADFGLGDVSIRKLGIWLFLLTEIMFFSALIGTAWSVRIHAGLWALPGEVLAIDITALNTFILIVSSFTIVQALDKARLGELDKMRLYLLATLIGGIAFISIQVFEYWQLLHEGLLPSAAPEVLRSAQDISQACAAEAGIYHGGHVPDGCQVVQLPASYGATFYAQTAFHGAHVTAGILGLAYLTKKAYNERFTREDHEAVELVGLYWHFVDVVWIFLFTIVYLI